jgi:hypothetical protein
MQNFKIAMKVKSKKHKLQSLFKSVLMLRFN